MSASVLSISATGDNKPNAAPAFLATSKHLPYILGFVARTTGNLIQEASGPRPQTPGDRSWTSPRSATWRHFTGEGSVSKAAQSVARALRADPLRPRSLGSLHPASGPRRALPRQTQHPENRAHASDLTNAQ